MEGGISMKYTLYRTANEPISAQSNWTIEKVMLREDELIRFLRHHLIEVMEGILDPDIAGKNPDGYLKSLQSGRLGDFSNKYIICAYDDKKVIGLLIGIPENDDIFHIYTVGVLPVYRKKGVATALISRCVNDMICRTANHIVLDVHADNKPAYNLYERLGFLVNK